MWTKIKLFFASIAIAFVPVLAVTPLVHAQETIEGGLCTGVNLSAPGSAGAQTNCDGITQGAADDVNNIITLVINIFSWIVGIISVIMIIVGGFKYIMSGGESGGVKGGKDTIMYALIGLVVVVLAQVIVRFVLGQATSTTTGA